MRTKCGSLSLSGHSEKPGVATSDGQRSRPTPVAAPHVASDPAKQSYMVNAHCALHRFTRDKIHFIRILKCFFTARRAACKQAMLRIMLHPLRRQRWPQHKQKCKKFQLHTCSKKYKKILQPIRELSKH